jgi:hypothetical protein
MEKHYHHLSTTDRVTLMFLKRQGLSLRAIASELNRSPGQGKRMKHFTPPESRQGSFHPVPLSPVCAGCRL